MERAAFATTSSTHVHPDPFSTGHPINSLSRSIPPTTTLNFVLPPSQATSPSYLSNFQDLFRPQPSVDAQVDTCALSREVHEIKHRRRTARQELKVLEETYIGNQKPNLSLRTTLGERLGMTPRQVQVWFQNRRAKDKKLDEVPLPQTELVPPPTTHRRGSAPALVQLDQGPPNGLATLRRGSLPASVFPSPPRAIRVGDAFGRRHSLAVAHQDLASHPYRHSITTRRLDAVVDEHQYQGHFRYPRLPAPPSLLSHPGNLPRLPYTLPPRITTQAIPGPMPAPGYSFGSCNSGPRSAEDGTLVEEESLPYPNRDNWTRPRYGSFVSLADSDSNSADAYSQFGSIPGGTNSRFGSIPGGGDQVLGGADMERTSNASPEFLQGFSSMQMRRESVPQTVTLAHREFKTSHTLHQYPSYSSSEPQLPSGHVIDPGTMPEPSASSFPLLSYDTFPQSPTPLDTSSFTPYAPPSFHPYPTSTVQNELSYQYLPHTDDDHHQPGISYMESYDVSSQFSPPFSVPPTSSDALSTELPSMMSTPDTHHTGASSTYSYHSGASPTDLISG